MRVAAETNALLEIGESLLAAGELRDALSALDEVLADRPDSLPALLGSAAALVQLGAPEQAYAYVDLAIGLAPDNVAVWRTATSVALAAGDGPMAKQAAVRRLEISADGIDGLMDLGLASTFDLDYPLARDAFAEAVRVAPDNEAARLWHDRLASISSEQQWLVEVGRAHCRRGRYARGLELFDRALNLGEDYDAHLYAGRALLVLGAAEGANEQFHAALALVPGDTEALAGLGMSVELARMLEPAGTEPAPTLCGQCGNQVLDDERFCIACGARIR